MWGLGCGQEYEREAGGNREGRAMGGGWRASELPKVHGMPYGCPHAVRHQLPGKHSAHTLRQQNGRV